MERVTIMTGAITVLSRIPVKPVMWFAIAYLLFFTLDILVVCQFQVFGMLPYSALVCSVSLYTIFMIRHVVRLQKTWLTKSIVIMWIVFFVLIFLENLVFTTYSLFWEDWLPAGTFFVVSSRTDHLLLFAAIILFVFNLFIKINNKVLQRWFLFSGGATVLHFIVPVFMNYMPVMVYRYQGFLGLPMLFGWLMINMTILNIKYSPDSESMQTIQKMGGVL